MGDSSSGVWSEEGTALRLSIDTRLYTEEAVFRACYLFTDRCYIVLAEGPDTHIVVRLSSKAGEPEALESIAGEFSNELISQRVRLSLAEETKAIREIVVRRAFAEGGFGE